MADKDFAMALGSGPSESQSGSPTVAATPGRDSQVAKAAQKERSQGIDKLIQEDKSKFKRECKILLLGKSPLVVVPH